MAAPLRIGSLCTGYGGLDMAVQAVFGGELAWVSDVDPAVNRLLEVRYPDVPNIGDLTASPDPEPVDIVIGGFPCQPVSVSGKRQGVEDERWIWGDIAALVGRMDPPPGVLVFENVPGLLSANGGNSMAEVIEGLASLGYVGRYRLATASSVGACHRRQRLFIVAQHPESGAWLHERECSAGPGHGTRQGGLNLRTDIQLLPTPLARDWRGRPGNPKSDRDSLPVAVFDTERWSDYATAIAQHEQALGRAAPDPIENGTLSARFVEWMMMLPDGWVTTGPVSSRTAQLRMLGNGVVPPQAENAIRSLIVGHRAVVEQAA